MDLRQELPRRLHPGLDPQGFLEVRLRFTGFARQLEQGDGEVEVDPGGVRAEAQGLRKLRNGPECLALAIPQPTFRRGFKSTPDGTCRSS
jgi:hypothetical protein